MDSQEAFIFPASFAQQRLWFLDQLIPGNTIYNVPTIIRLTGSLNTFALEQTFNEIVRRHETLRTTFMVSDGQPLQVILPSLIIFPSIFDLQQLPPDQREVEAKRIIAAEIERPFDLSSEPLLRVIVIVLSETEHILNVNMHHIICDDWSIGVLIRELGTLYAAFRDTKFGDVIPLPELPLQYADFAHWQRQWLQGEVLQNQLAYWRQQLDGISMLHLPSQMQHTQTFDGATQFLEVPKHITDALQTLSQQEGATLFMTLLAAFQILLYRYTHQEDIAVGSPIANRNRSEIEGLIGFFVNSLVLRTDLSGNPTFRELLSRVREVTLGAYSHQDLPFEKLVEELHPDRNLSQHPLFQVVFSLQNAPMSALELPGLVPSFINVDFKKTRFDLELHLWKCSDDFRSLWGANWEYSEGLRGIIVYSTDLYDKATISRMLEHFKTLLSGIVENPEQRIANLPLLSQTETHQILVEWNNTQANYPHDKCIHQLFENQVEQHPNSIAITFENNNVETRYIASPPNFASFTNITSLTYKELNIRSNQVAHRLQKLGVGAEVLVGICISQSVEMIIGLIGILKAGGAYLPLDPSYPQERLNFMLADAQVSVLLTQEKLLKYFPDFSNPIVCIDNWDIAQENKENPKNSVTSDNLAYVIYTSGSTGKPKGVAVTHKAVNRLVCNTNYIKLSPDDKIAQASNTSFDAATFEIWGALINGAQLVGISKYTAISPQEFALKLQQKGITILFLTTALFQQIARDVPQAFASLKYLLFGGETVDIRWVRKVIKYGSPEHLIHVYGPTENTTFSTYYCVQELSESATSIPIGRPIANTQVYILDSHLQPVPINVIGELYIGGDGLARGYLNRPELTNERFIDNVFNDKNNAIYDKFDCLLDSGRGNPAPTFKTGDLARYLPDGNIEFLGRIDNQIKIRGYRIELSEIEAVLTQHPAVRETVVTACEDIPDDKYLVAYIVSNVGIATQETQSFALQLRQFMQEKLPEYMLPKAYIILESIPLTPNGKIDRRALPMPDSLTFDNLNYVAPQTQVEKLLVEIWAKLLGKEQIGVRDNFFELGGHSLLATQLVSRIRDAFKIDLPVRNLFEAPTVEQFARYIDTMRWAAKGVDETEVVGQREEMEF